MRKFIETTSDNNNHGGAGWEYGTCLWSPIEDKGGAKIYELMHVPNKDDLIIHFYDEKGTRYIHGQSYVEKTCYITTTKPPNPSRYSFSEKFYRIDLKEFRKFNNPIPLKDFTDAFELEIRHEYEENPPDYPFQISRPKDPNRNSFIGLKNGKYLTESTSQLFNLIQEIEDIQEKNTENKNDSSSNKKEYLETRRKIIESTFFARNPNLKKDAIKAKGSLKCEACGFLFEEKYGKFGADYIECHHENPLSERPEKEWTDELKTSIEDVKLLCSNCHRMIHHTRPAKKFSYLVEIVKENI